MITIPMARGLTAIVDNEDADLALLRWYPRPRHLTTYAGHDFWENGKKKHRGIHRVIGERMGIVGAVDHVNRDGLDNRRQNLRAAGKLNNANRRLQSNNTSGYRGVMFDARFRKHWYAQIRIDRKLRGLGYYMTPEEAARAYDAAALNAFGEFAQVNFPEAKQCSIP